jgi:hypothetical protein
VFLLTAIDLKNAKVYQGEPQAGKPDCTLTLADEDMVQIVSTSNQTTVFREMGCEDGRWMELAQDHVQWQALVLAVLNLRVLLPES